MTNYLQCQLQETDAEKTQTMGCKGCEGDTMGRCFHFILKQILR